MPALRLSNRSPLALTGWLIAVAVIAFRLLPGLGRPGMFFDGVTHAAVARNMAVGTGDFWHPIFSPADGAGYHEQPPLGFWLESLVFRALGDHFWVEKLYSAIVALATAVTIAAIWRRLAGERAKLHNLDWLPVAVWAAMPGWGWMFGNNMLENTLGLFTTLAVYAILRATDTRGSTSHLARRAGCLVLGAACIVAAVLSKGPVGLFPLATPLAMCIACRCRRISTDLKGEPRPSGSRESRSLMVAALLECMALIAMVAAAFGLVLLSPGASDYLGKYLHEQLFASLAGQREVVSSALGRFDILLKLVRELAVPGAIAGLLMFAARRRGLPVSFRNDDVRRASFVCLLIAASASLPIIASPKQSGHYAFPSYALYALAIAFWCAPAVIFLLTPNSDSDDDIRRLIVRRRHLLLRSTSATVFIAVVAASIALAGQPQRDADVYRDTRVLGRLLPHASIVGLTKQLADDYPLLTNLARGNFIGAERTTAGHEFVLAPADGPLPDGFDEVSTELTRYRLLERRTVVTQSAGSERTSPKR